MSTPTSRLFAAALACALALSARAATPPPQPPLPPSPAGTGSWRWLQPSLGAADLNDVTFPETGHGYAVGAGGTVLRTNDGGSTWEARSTPSGTGDLSAVSASGALVVACGKAGTLLRSVDGGSTFQAVPWMLNRRPPDFVDVQLLDATSGVLVASDGTFLTTSDAFQSYQIVGTITTVTPHALWFTSPQKGWVVGGNATSGTIVQTTDGGHSFNVVHNGNGGEYRAVTGLSIGTTSFVLAAGATLPRATYLDESKPAQGWTDVELPGGAINAASIALGASTDQPELWFAADDGLWDIRVGDQTVQRPLTQTSPRLTSVAAPTRGEAFAVGQGGSIYLASYGGGPAKIVNGGHAEAFTAATFPTSDGQRGAFATLDGTTAKLVGTTDGAQTFTALQTAPSPIVALSAVDAQHGFGILQNGDFYATSDGGVTWTRVVTLTDRPTALACSSTSVCYAAGARVAQTTDGGRTWHSVGQGTSAPFVAVAVGSGGAVAAVSKDLITYASGTYWVQFASGVCQFTAVAIESTGEIVIGGSTSAGGGCIERMLPAGAPSVPTPMSAPVTSLVAVGTRVFGAFADGHVSEIDALASGISSETSVFQSHAQLTGLVARSVTDASGATHPAPIAYGQFGALLVFDDNSSPVPPLQAPVVTVTPATLSLPPGQLGKVLATATDPQGLPLTYVWSDPNDAGLSFGTPDQQATSVSWAQPPPAGTKAVARVTVCDSAGACSTADVVVDSGPGSTTNLTPVAVAKGVAVQTGQPILLDGSGSSDPDGDPLTYAWQQLSGPPAQLEGPVNGPILVANAPDSPADLVFELKVCDPESFCARIEVTVVVSGPNQNSPPVAMTKGDLTVKPGALVDLDASDSYDPEDGPVASFAWRQASGPTVTLQTPTDAVASFIAGPSGTAYRFIVRVCDSQNACSEAGTNVTVSAGTPPANLPPSVQARQPQMTANVGDVVTLSALATDPEGQPVKVTWTDDQPALGLNLQLSGPADASFTVPADAAGQTLKFTVTACDPQGACATAEATVTVGLPSVVANAGSDQTVAPDATVTLDGSASTGNIAGYAWTQTGGPAVHLSGADQPKATFTAPASAGILIFTLTVTGNDGRSAAADVKVVVTGPVMPLADAGLDQTVGWGARVQLDGRGSSDPAGRPLTFAWKGPAGLPLAGADSALASFYAPSNNVRLAFTLTVCAGQGACSDSGLNVIVQKNANLPPLPDAGPDLRAMGGATVLLDGTGSLDPEGETLTATWTQSAGTPAKVEAPDALWTQVQLPDVTAEETLTFALKVCDPEHACAVATVDVDVLPAGPQAPTVSASIEGHPDGTVAEDADFTVQLAVQCPAAPCADQGELRLVSGPPLARAPGAGFTFHTPAVARAVPFSFEASVCDTAGRCATTTLDGLVQDTVNEAPVALAGPDQTVARRQAVILDASDSFDPNGDALTFAWTETSGAPTALVAAASPRARFVVPADATAGDLAFQVQVCDDRGACASATTKVTVTDGPPVNRPPLADAAGDRVGPAGVPIVLDGSRSFDPDGDPLTYAWSITSGSGAALAAPDQETTKLVISGPTPKDAPVVVQLKVCDPYAACSTDVVHVTTYAPPVDPAAAAVHLGAATQGCGCAGDPTSMLGLLAGALAFAFRRRRR